MRFIVYAALLYVYPSPCLRSIIVHRHQRFTKPDRQSFLHQIYKHTAKANVNFFLPLKCLEQLSPRIGQHPGGHDEHPMHLFAYASEYI